MHLVNFEKNDHERIMVFPSGMFAEHWMWQPALPYIKNAQLWTVERALCSFGSKTEEIAAKLIPDIEALGRPVTFVTNSLGSHVAMEIAAKRPDLAEELIISGCPGFGPIQLDVKWSPKDTMGAAITLTNLIYSDHEKIDPEVAGKINDCLSQNLKRVFRLIRESNEANADELIKRVQCPITAIWGGDDKLTPRDWAIDCLLSNDIKVLTLNQIGHSPMLESGKMYAELLNEICTESPRKVA